MPTPDPIFGFDRERGGHRRSCGRPLLLCAIIKKAYTLRRPDAA